MKAQAIEKYLSSRGYFGGYTEWEMRFADEFHAVVVVHYRPGISEKPRTFHVITSDSSPEKWRVYETVADVGEVYKKTRHVEELLERVEKAFLDLKKYLTPSSTH